MGGAGAPMMPSSHDSVAHDQHGSDGRVWTGLADTQACLPQRSLHKDFVTVLRGHVSGISARDAQRNSAVLKRARSEQCWRSQLPESEVVAATFRYKQWVLSKCSLIHKLLYIRSLLMPTSPFNGLA